MHLLQQLKEFGRKCLCDLFEFKQTMFLLLFFSEKVSYILDF